MMPILLYISKVFENRLRCSYDDISAIDDFFDQWDPSTATQMKEVNVDYKGNYFEK